MLQNKLHVFCCPFYCSFSYCSCFFFFFSFFVVQTSVFIQNYVDFGPLFLGIIIHFVLVWSFFFFCFFLEKQVYCQPQMYELYKAVRGHVSPDKKKKWKLDSRKRHILHSLDRRQLIHRSILFSFQFSVSLFIIPVRCFQSHFKVKQIANYSMWSHSSSPANQSAF